MKTRKSRLWTVAVIAYILFIFSNSMKPAGLSSADSGTVLELVRNICASVSIDSGMITEHIIRKLAHFSEYTLLGIFLFSCLDSYELGRESRGMLQIILGFSVPFTDETIQLFVAGRSGQISDVWLDCAGVVFGTLICWAMVQIHGRKREKKRG